jgi:hypothetical protein
MRSRHLRRWYPAGEARVAGSGGLSRLQSSRSTDLCGTIADEHHAIWTVLSSMVWTDVAFRTLTNFAVGDEANALNNHLMVEAMLDGHVATQVRAIRRLVDKRKTDIISLRRLVKDLRSHFALFTRENYVCFDGLPYDYEALRHARFMENAGNWGKGGIWVPTSGPQGDGTSESAHRQFDKLAGIDPAKRSREDRLPVSLLTTIDGSTAVALTTSRNGAMSILLTRAGQKRGNELPTLR